MIRMARVGRIHFADGSCAEDVTIAMTDHFIIVEQASGNPIFYSYSFITSMEDVEYTKPKQQTIRFL